MTSVAARTFMVLWAEGSARELELELELGRLQGSLCGPWGRAPLLSSSEGGCRISRKESEGIIPGKLCQDRPVSLSWRKRGNRGRGSAGHGAAAFRVLFACLVVPNCGRALGVE